MIVNTPCNPTGAAYDMDTLRMLARISEEYDLLILADEIYTRYLYDGAFVPMRTGTNSSSASVRTRPASSTAQASNRPASAPPPPSANTPRSSCKQNFPLQKTQSLSQNVPEVSIRRRSPMRTTTPSSPVIRPTDASSAAVSRSRKGRSSTQSAVPPAHAASTASSAAPVRAWAAARRASVRRRSWPFWPGNSVWMKRRSQNPAARPVS